MVVVVGLYCIENRGREGGVLVLALEFRDVFMRRVRHVWGMWCCGEDDVALVRGRVMWIVSRGGWVWVVVIFVYCVCVLQHIF